MTNLSRILVVDDVEELGGLVVEVLRDQGYAAASVADGWSALEVLSRYPADLVLADYWMPGMDGIELIQQIRKEIPDQKALLMTAFDGGWDAPGMEVAGCVRKPIDIEDLVWMIDRTLACKTPNELVAAYQAEKP